MIHSVRFTCILDTNVIYPLWIRDLLLWFAHHELYTPKWSHHIFDEWLEVMKRKGVAESDANKRIEILNEAFPDALVQNYEPLIETLCLPDIKDKHVLAAAIKTNANLIVTNNLKDFPRISGLSIVFSCLTNSHFPLRIDRLKLSATHALFKKVISL